MPGRFVRSKIAQLVAETIGSRQAREQLKEHGWRAGIPIIMAQHDEKLSDVLALVVVHEPPVMVATLDPDSGDLCFMYVVIGCSDLRTVDPLPTSQTVRDLYNNALSVEGCLTFRVKPLVHSAIAHAAPPMKGLSTAARRNPVSSDAGRRA